MKKESLIMIVIVISLVAMATAWSFAGQNGKIAVSAEGKNPSAAVSSRAGLSPYFLIFDEKGKLIEAIDNPFKEERGRAGHLMADFLAGRGVSIAVGEDFCGEIVDVIKSKGITPVNFKGSVEEAVQKILKSN
jgi:predicted Fe-Mo cluster-binding NifX family protein